MPGLRGLDRLRFFLLQGEEDEMLERCIFIC